MVTEINVFVEKHPFLDRTQGYRRRRRRRMRK